MAARVWALPWNMNVGLLYYRADLLARHGLAPPRTWDGARARRSGASAPPSGIPRLDGVLWQGKQYEGLMCNVARGALGRRHRAARRRRRVLPGPGARGGRARASCAGSSPRGVSPPWTTAADEELTRRAFGDGARDLPAQLALRARSLRGGGLAGARQGRHRAAAAAVAPACAAARARPAARTSACRRATRHPEVAVALARFLAGEARAAAMIAGGALLADAHGALPRPRPRARAAALPAFHELTLARAAAAGDAVLPDAVHDAPAGALGGAGRREDARARGRATRGAGSSTS